ncbi:uncharacterized protein LOC135464679 [Liolophura sinensis]|uniref:uncharacterized protein LOC135464679 n=1 Tax=Liolophura sinensis TaxID=3198878 RepID=UPI00315803F8
MNRFFKYLQVPFVSKTAYEEHQNKFLFPVIDKKWQEEQEAMMEELKTLGEGLHIGGDGRADSPGHSAKYGTYTTMELHLGKVINLQLVQSNEAKNSNWMELEGLKRSIDCLKSYGVELDAIVTDRHRSVAKWIRENLQETKHYFDIWHVAKGLGKKLDKLGQTQDCALVKEWKKSIINHLYWCAASTPDGNPEMMFAKWLSLCNHILGVHDGHSDLFPKCEHGPLAAPREKKWFKPGEKVTVELEKILTDTWRKKDVRQLSPLGQTSSLEGFHSTILHFAPKHTSFQYKGMHYRVILAALHVNENSGRERAYERSGEKQLTVYFSKAKKGEPSVRWETVASTYGE